MANEIELKYALSDKIAPEQVFSAVSEYIVGEIKTLEMHSKYFDTRDNFLYLSRASLRLRHENEKSVVTVKTPKSSAGALSRRGEWQVEAESIPNALPYLEKEGCPANILTIAREELCTVAEFCFTRRCAHIKTNQFEAELCVDIGYLSPDGIKKAPLREVEVELISGDITALCTFGEDLSKRFSMRSETLSKLTRARNLK